MLLTLQRGPQAWYPSTFATLSWEVPFLDQREGVEVKGGRVTKTSHMISSPIPEQTRTKLVYKGHRHVMLSYAIPYTDHILLLC